MKLDKNFSDDLVNLPETGLGYQNVSVVLKDGSIVTPRIVLNSEILVTEKSDKFTPLDISEIIVI